MLDRHTHAKIVLRENFGSEEGARKSRELDGLGDDRPRVLAKLDLVLF